MPAFNGILFVRWRRRRNGEEHRRLIIKLHIFQSFFVSFAGRKFHLTIVIHSAPMMVATVKNVIKVSLSEWIVGSFVEF